MMSKKYVYPLIMDVKQLTFDESLPLRGCSCSPEIALDWATITSDVKIPWEIIQTSDDYEWTWESVSKFERTAVENYYA